MHYFTHVFYATYILKIITRYKIPQNFLSSKRAKYASYPILQFFLYIPTPISRAFPFISNIQSIQTQAKSTSRDICRQRGQINSKTN